MILVFLWVFAATGDAETSTPAATCPPPATSSASAPSSTSSPANSLNPAPEQIVACVGAQSITGATFFISTRIQKQVTAGDRGPRNQQRALGRFLEAFKLKWTPQTYCEPGYATSNCGHVQAGL